MKNKYTYLNKIVENINYNSNRAKKAQRKNSGKIITQRENAIENKRAEESTAESAHERNKRTEKINLHTYINQKTISCIDHENHKLKIKNPKRRKKRKKIEQNLVKETKEDSGIGSDIDNIKIGKENKDNSEILFDDLNELLSEIKNRNDTDFCKFKLKIFFVNLKEKLIEFLKENSMSVESKKRKADNDNNTFKKTLKVNEEYDLDEEEKITYSSDDEQTRSDTEEKINKQTSPSSINLFKNMSNPNINNTPSIINNNANPILSGQQINEKPSGAITPKQKTPDNRDAKTRRQQNKQNKQDKKEEAKLVINLNNKERQVTSPMLLEEVKKKLTFDLRSIDKVGDRVYLYTHKQAHAEEIMKQDSDFLKGCSRKNMDLINTTFIIYNTSINEINDNTNLKQQLNNLGISAFEGLNKKDKNSLAVRAFCDTKSKVKDLFIKYYESGIKITIDDEEVTLKMEADCGRPTQCFKCWQIGHHRNQCKPDMAELCAKCGEPGHLKANCKNKPHCAFCGGDHNALDKKNCIKYETLHKQKKAQALESITGITNFSKAKFAAKSYSEAASYSKEFDKREKEAEKKFANKNELAQIIAKNDANLIKATETLTTAQEYLRTVQASMKETARAEGNKVYKDIIAATNPVLQQMSFDQIETKHELVTVRRILREAVGGEAKYNELLNKIQKPPTPKANRDHQIRASRPPPSPYA
jgi:hypothetical protein